MLQKRSMGLVLVCLAVVILTLCSVGARRDDPQVQLTEIERGTIDVDGTAVSFLGNLGSSPSGSSAPGADRNVLLLHGAKYSAQTWKDLGTLALLANSGYRVAAVDLPKFVAPGDPLTYGDALPHHFFVHHSYVVGPLSRDRPRDEILELVCRRLGMAEDSPAVVVSPSMSGSFSIPLLLRKPDLFSGYLPVATGQALSYEAKDFEAVMGVPTLIVYGELDTMGARASSILEAIPNSHVLMIPGATHPAYLDDPVLFHNELLRFLGEGVTFSHDK